MRHIARDKYTIAWFKLADCIAKGEREKAFGVYRLLVHSLDDQAYAYKLEGDLLFAFQDAAAAEKYMQAATLYHQHNKLKEAAALYEELIFLGFEQDKYIHKLLEIYQTQASPLFINKCIKLFEGLIGSEYAPPKAEIVIEALEPVVDEAVLIDLYQKFSYALLKHPRDEDLLKTTIEKTLLLLTQQHNDHGLHNFLATLESYNPKLYAYAVQCLKK